jgi:hypothetical protein
MVERGAVKAAASAQGGLVARPHGDRRRSAARKVGDRRYSGGADGVRVDMAEEGTSGMREDPSMLSRPGGRRYNRQSRRAGAAARARPRTAGVLAVALLVGAAGGGAVGVEAAPAGGAPPTAHVARTLNVKDEGHLHLSGRPSGSAIIEEGTVMGTLPGTVKVRFNIGATISAQFTIYARGGGSISGHGSGSLHSTSVYSTFGGTLSVTSGTGRFRHAHGSGGLYGAINRKTDALTVQTIGKLSY